MSHFRTCGGAEQCHRSTNKSATNIEHRRGGKQNGKLGRRGH